MLSWIPALIQLWDSFSPTYVVGAVVVACLGMIAAGMAYQALASQGDDDKNMAALVVSFATVAIAFFWPLVVIIAPFLAAAGVLFFGGRYAATKLAGRL